MENYQPIILTVTFIKEFGGDIAKFKLTIPELPREGWFIKINDAKYEVWQIGTVDYSQETAIVYLK